MSSLIAFDLSNSEKEIVSTIIPLAISNKTLPGNSSIITQNCKIQLDPKFSDEFKKNNIPVFCYSTKEELDQHLITNHVLFLFRACQEIPDITPLSTPLAVCGPSQAKHGDIFCDSSEWPINVNNLEVLMEQFHSRIIQKISSIIPTVGFFGDKGTAVIFVGSSPQKDLTIVRRNAMISRTMLSRLPQDGKNVKYGVIGEEFRGQALPLNEELKKKNLSSIPSLSLLRQTLESITSRKDEKIKVKMLCNWTSSSQLLRDWSHMMENSLAIRNIEWIVEGIPDYWVVVNKPPEGEQIIPKQTIVFRMEPYIDNTPFYNDWLNGKKKTDFLYFLDHENHRNNTEWWLGLSASESSKPIEKTSLFSTVVSSQYSMEGHRLRIDFIKFFQANSAICLHVFGHDNSHTFQNYHGSLPLRRKDAGILPYKYHFAAENSAIPNYMTEKFFDAVIGECLLFYWGCPNISEHVDQRAFIQLDLKNPEESLKIIETAILSNEWEKRIPIIRGEKRRIMSLFNPFIRISSLIHIQNLKCVQVLNFSSSAHNIPGLNIQHLVPIQQLQVSHQPFRNYRNSTISLEEIMRLIRHYSLWTACANENKPFLIFEGNPVSNFLDHLSEIWAEIEYLGIEWDLIKISNNVSGKKNIESKELTIKRNELERQMSSFGYILRPNSAKKLVNLINDHGFLNCLDDLLTSFSEFIKEWKMLNYSKSLFIPEKSEVSGKMFKIIRKNQDGQLNNIIPSSWPPALNSEVQLVPESE